MTAMVHEIHYCIRHISLGE